MPIYFFSFPLVSTEDIIMSEMLTATVAYYSDFAFCVPRLIAC